MNKLQNTLLAFRIVRQACPSYPFLTLLLALTGVVAPLTGVLGIKLLIDALMALDAAATGLITALTSLFQSWYQTVYEPTAKVRIAGALTGMLLGRIAAFDLAALEDPEFYNQYTRAVSEANTRAQGVVNSVCGLVGNLASLATLTAILLSIDAVVLLLTLVGAALMFLLNLKKSRLSFSQYLERTRLERQLHYIQRVYYEPQYAREIRLFAMNTFMMSRYNGLYRALRRLWQRQGLRLWLFSGLEKLLNNSLYIVITLTYLAGRYFAGAIALSGFSALFNGVFQFGDQLYALMSRIPELYQHSLYLETVQSVLKKRPLIENTTGYHLDPTAPHRIELRDVTFAYPGRPPVFEQLNLTIEAGEQVALLGHNGAGKSTLIRLLLRFYDPQQGQILVDGRDIRTLDLASLRRCYGVVLQDFQHFAFSIADNITLGRAPQKEEQLSDAICQAGLDDKIRHLPHGLDTAITREFAEDGIQLSGGEAQKLALARAYLQNSGMLLFDEPSSALDPVAEHRLFGDLRQYARNKTVLYVCHKMALALQADRAVLLEQGRIVEQGAPHDLLQKEGLFASLFRLQAETFRPAV
jgi:ATP-binding cassette subfamily B protein